MNAALPDLSALALPERPKLRFVEAMLIESDEGAFLHLRDPVGLAAPVALPAEMVLLLDMFDGERSLADIRVEFFKAGAPLPEGFIEQLCRELHDQRWLEGPWIDRHFAACASRPMVHAEGGYPEDPERCRAMLDGFLRQAPAPEGVPGDENGAPTPFLVAPHIDLQRGGACYGAVYRHLRDATASVFVVLGTSHMAPKAPFTFCEHPFQTPFGEAPIDDPLLERLRSSLGAQFAVDPAAHWAEHSIEFQVLWLSYLFGGKHPFSIVPILCASFQELIEHGRSPREIPEIARFIDALRQALAEDEREIVVIAGADLAHLGAQFGGEEEITEEFLAELKRRDLALWEPVLRGDAQAFYRVLCQDGNDRNVCSVANLYTLLELADGAPGVFAGYQQAVSEEGVVTFAGAVFHDRGT